MQKLTTLILSILISLIVCGCSDQSLYEKVGKGASSIDEMASSTYVSGKTDIKAFSDQKVYEFSRVCKAVAPWTIIGSIALGLLTLRLVQHARGIRKFALFVLIIGVPIVMFALTFGVSYLAGALN